MIAATSCIRYCGTHAHPIVPALLVFGLLLVALFIGSTIGQSRPAACDPTHEHVGRGCRVVGHTSTPRDQRSSMARPRSRSHGGEHRRRPEPRNAR